MSSFFSGPFNLKTLAGFGLWCCLCLLPTAVQSATNNSATLQWIGNSESDLAGYNVYQGTTAGSYGPSIDVKNVTTYRASNLQGGLTYSFAITAYDTSGNESRPSEEVRKYIAESSPDVTPPSQSLTALTNKTTVTVTAAANQAPTPTVSPTVDAGLTPIPQEGWRLLTTFFPLGVDSQETVREDGQARNAFDGNPTTLWHTQWAGGSPAPPHEIWLDLGATYTIDGFRYLPRRSSSNNGRMGGYAFYVSATAPATPGAWGSPVATGTFRYAGAGDAAEREVLFVAVPGRYVRLVATSEWQGGPWTAINELNVLGSRPIAVGSDRPLIPQEGWRLLTTFFPLGVDSQETVREDGQARNAFDGNPTTLWHTQWAGGSPAPPHEIWLDLGATYTIDGFRYLPRRSSSNNGRMGGYAFYVSATAPATPGAWGSPVATGTFRYAGAGDAAEREVLFVAVPGRYVRLVATSEWQGGPWTAINELNVLGTTGSGGSPLIAESSPDVTPPSQSLTALTNKTTVTVTAAANQAPTPTVSPTVDAGLTPIPQEGWRLLTTFFPLGVDSQETVREDGQARNAFDGNPTTLWHTQWAGGSPAPPHEIWLDLGATYTIDGFRYLPRRSSSNNGRMGGYAFYVSATAPATPGAWGSPVATGTFRYAGAGDAAEREVLFVAVPGRYVRLVATSEWQGGPWTAINELNVLGSRPIAVGSDRPLIPQEGWRLLTTFFPLGVDSQETVREDGQARNAFDGNPTTLWHTQWAGGSPAPPHEIWLDLGATYTIDGFRYLPRRSSSNNGRMGGYAFYVSATAPATPGAWGSPVATGTFRYAGAGDAAEREVLFVAVPGRYVRLVATSEWQGGPWTAINELNVLGTTGSGGSPPTDIPQG